MAKVAPSVLSADFSKLGEEVKAIEAAGAKYVHLDVMDGHFVPNITFGAPIIKSLRPVSDIIFDAHLMISDPLSYIDDFAAAGCDYIVFHYESNGDPAEIIHAIKAKNIKVGMSIKPKTEVNEITQYLGELDLVLVMSVEPGFGGQSYIPASTEKIAKLKGLRDENGYHYLIQVDGGMNKTTAQIVIDAGIDIIVAGSSVFGAADYKQAMNDLGNTK